MFPVNLCWFGAPVMLGVSARFGKGAINDNSKEFNSDRHVYAQYCLERLTNLCGHSYLRRHRIYMRSVLYWIVFFLSAILLACTGLDDKTGLYRKSNYVGVHQELKALAEQGNVPAQFNLGLMYYNGQGVTQDYSETVKWFRKAAEQGNAPAQSNLGLMYYNGQGVAQDYSEAVKWYRRAAEQGNAPAQSNLGGMYLTGQGVPKNDVEAAKWYHKAAEQGYAAAQSILGAMYEYGQGVPKNNVEAVKWYHKAAEQGYPVAQYNLGVVYSTGQGVLKDDVEAVKWYRKAAEQGNTDSQTALDVYYQRQDIPNSIEVSSIEIPLKKRGGVYELPVKINGVISLEFILDTGASEVTIPADVALTLLRTGTIGHKDFLRGKSYQLADGSIMRSSRLIIRELDLGGVKITQVPASITPATGSLLLGQSFLGRLGLWSLDNKRNILILKKH